jgi:chloride channel 7
MAQCFCHVLQENDVEREFQIHRTEEDYALAEFWKWALAFLIGVSMGCIGFIVDWGIESLNNFKYYHTVGVISTQGARLAFQPPTGHVNMLW